MNTETLSKERKKRMFSEIDKSEQRANKRTICSLSFLPKLSENYEYYELSENSEFLKFSEYWKFSEYSHISNCQNIQNFQNSASLPIVRIF